MADVRSIRVKLDFPLEHVKEPVIYHLVTDYRLIPDIRRANIDVHAGGMMVLEPTPAPRISALATRSKSNEPVPGV